MSNTIQNQDIIRYNIEQLGGLQPTINSNLLNKTLDMHNTLLSNELRNIEKNFKVHGNRNYDDLLNDNQMSNNLPNHNSLMNNFMRRE